MKRVKDFAAKCGRQLASRRITNVTVTPNAVLRGARDTAWIATPL